MVDLELYEFINYLAAHNCSVPEPGYELTGETGGIVASAELGWESLKIAALRGDELQYRALFEGADWKVFSLGEVVSNPEAFQLELNEMVGGI